MTPIPIIGFHRGIGLHDQQNERRLQVVRREIDQVIEMHDLVPLVDWAGSAAHSPESRQLAGQKGLAIVNEAGDARQKRPRGLTPEFIESAIAGLSSQGWRSPTHYGLLCDHGAVPRETPLEID